MMAEQDRRILAEFTRKVCECFPDAGICKKWGQVPS